MFPPATLGVAHRLLTALMTLVGAVTDIAASGGTPTFSELAAHSLFFRLARLVAALVRIATKGPRRRKRAQPDAPTATRVSAAPNPLSIEARRLRGEPGWLLAALPDTAPAIAADVDALLADPATAALLDAEPTLLRSLNPLLRSLGLTPLPTPAAPPPDTAPPAAPAPAPASLPRDHHTPPCSTPPKPAATAHRLIAA